MLRKAVVKMSYVPGYFLGASGRRDQFKELLPRGHTLVASGWQLPRFLTTVVLMLHYL